MSEDILSSGSGGSVAGPQGTPHGHDMSTCWHLDLGQVAAGNHVIDYFGFELIGAYGTDSVPLDAAFGHLNIRNAAGTNWMSISLYGLTSAPLTVDNSYVVLPASEVGAIDAQSGSDFTKSGSGDFKIASAAGGFFTGAVIVSTPSCTLDQSATHQRWLYAFAASDPTGSAYSAIGLDGMVPLFDTSWPNGS